MWNLFKYCMLNNFDFNITFLAHLSSKLKWAILSHSVQHPSVCMSACVHSSVCLSACVHPSVRKLSSPEPLCQFQPSFALSITGEGNSSLMKWRATPSFRGRYKELLNICWYFSKIFSYKTVCPKKLKLICKHYQVVKIQFWKKKSM